MGERFTLRSNARYTEPQEVVAPWPEGTSAVHAECYLTEHADNVGTTVTYTVFDGPSDQGPWVFRCTGVLNGPDVRPPPPRPAEVGSTVMRTDRRAGFDFLRVLMELTQPSRFRAEGEWLDG